MNDQAIDQKSRRFECSPMRIGVFCHVGNQNLGDEATFAAVIQNIKRRQPHAEVYGVTANPDDTEQRHGITAFPIRRRRGAAAPRQTIVPVAPRDACEQPRSARDKVVSAIKRMPAVFFVLKRIQAIWGGCRSAAAEIPFVLASFKNIRGTDLLIVAGSQQLIDFIDGPWHVPYTHFKWSLLAAASGTRVAFVSVGAGPLQSSLGKLFVRYALSHAFYRSFRDESSRRLVESIGIQGENHVFPDLAFSLRIADDSAGNAPGSSSRVVGINPVPFNNPDYWPGSDPQVYERYTRSLAAFARWLADRGYVVLFFSTQLALDPPVIGEICAQIPTDGFEHPDRIAAEKPIDSIDELVSAIAVMDFVVAARFHGVLIPLLLHKPMLGVAYHEKTAQLMEQMGQSEYSIDIFSVDAADLQNRFMSLESRADAIRAELDQKVAACQQALEVQYDLLFARLQAAGAA